MKNKKISRTLPGNDEDYIHYLYRITNKINGKYYHGIHSLPKDLGKTPENDGYWGSGTEIVKAIREEGRENFTKEIVKTFSTRDELAEAEKDIVTIEEVRNPDCYNLTEGGDSNMEHLGWVVCRPKDAIDKVIKITREEYYKNKDKYVLTGHIKYYTTGKGTPRATGKSIKNKRAEERKRSRELGNYSARNKYVNKDTLEEITIVGRDKPEGLYVSWFPHYFLDRIHKVFIDEKHFKTSYEMFTNLIDLSKYFGIGRKSTRRLKEYYSGVELVEKTKKGKTRTKGFSGKTYINKDGETKVVNKSEVDSYLKDGWKPGKSLN